MNQGFVKRLRNRLIGGNMAVGIKDVAERAGVSTATVSHVINKTRYVSAEITSKVEKAMEELSYIPNLMAKSLKVNRSNVVGLIVPDISNFFFTEIASVIENTLHKKGYNLVLCNTNENLQLEKEHISFIQSYKSCGMIIAPTTKSFDYASLLQEKDFPVVFFDRRLDHPIGDSVTVDTYTLTKKAVSHMISQGHRRIAFIGGHQGLSTTEDRIEGYKAALADGGIPFDPALVEVGNAKLDVAYDICSRVIAKQNVSAVFVASSLMSVGVMKYLVDNKFSIPEQIAVIGFDDYVWNEVTYPPMTTIKQPTTAMGETAARLAVERIENRSLKHRNIILDGEIVFRQSC